jgi:hypothetical protein
MTHPVSNTESSGAARAHFLVKCTLTAKLSTVVCMGTLERRKSIRVLVEAAEAAPSKLATTELRVLEIWRAASTGEDPEMFRLQCLEIPRY